MVKNIIRTFVVLLENDLHTSEGMRALHTQSLTHAHKMTGRLHIMIC